MTRKILLVTVLGLVAAESWAQSTDVNALLSQWSVITSGDLDLVNDIQGASYIGGNVVVPNSFNAATVGTAALPTSDISLAVAGNIESGGNLQVNGGSVVVGGTVSRTINMNSHGTITQGQPSALPASPVGVVTSASQYWSTLAGNSSTSVANNGQLDFNCATLSSVAVFNISASQMFGSGYQGFTLLPSSATHEVLINVSGTTVNWNTGGFFSQFNTPTWDGRVLFNFYNATSVDLSGQIGGYVVAPNANVMENNNIDGGVMARTLTVGSEIDLPNNSNGASAWDGDLPNPPAVPEAPTFVSGVSLLIGAATSLWRRCRKIPALG